MGLAYHIPKAGENYRKKEPRNEGIMPPCRVGAVAFRPASRPNARGGYALWKRFLNAAGGDRQYCFGAVTWAPSLAAACQGQRGS